MVQSIGIVGAGLTGRLLGVRLSGAGWDVTLFDKDDEQGRDSCTYVSAGMIAPSCELETAERDVSELGMRSLREWPDILAQLDGPVFFRQNGSIVVAHPKDRDDLLRLRRRVEDASPNPEFMQVLSQAEIRELEPELGERFHSGLFLSYEAHMDNRAAMAAMAATLKKRGAKWVTGAEVSTIQPHQVAYDDHTHTFDWVADCRGLGAQGDLPDLRGVRGEILQVFAPEVTLSRPVRLMHPRYPIYIVPREDHVYVIGATAIESEDLSPVTVRSALELLSAAYTVHTGFSEARVLELSTHCRPAFPDNHPRILHRDGLLRINGLYRHGFLLSPAISQFACALLEGREVPPDAGEMIQEIET